MIDAPAVILATYTTSALKGSKYHFLCSDSEDSESNQS